MTPTSQTMQIANAIAAWAPDIAPGVWIARSSPAKNLETITSRVQYVWGFSREIQLQTRGGGKEGRPEFALAIAERLPPPPADGEAIFDAELKKMEDLADGILGEQFNFGGGQIATVINVRHEPLFDRTFLEQHRVIACAIVAGCIMHLDS